MTTWLRLSTIKRKLTLIIMLTCSVALVLACAAILLFEHQKNRDRLLQVPVPIALSTLWLPIICTVDHNHRLLS